MTDLAATAKYALNPVAGIRFTLSTRWSPEGDCIGVTAHCDGHEATVWGLCPLGRERDVLRCLKIEARRKLGRLHGI